MANLLQLLAAIRAEAVAASSFLVEVGPLTLSIVDAVEGDAVVIAIVGRTAGGTVICIAPDFLVFDPVASTIAGTVTTPGVYDITLRETHPKGTNSPRLSVIPFTINARPPAPGFWTADSIVISADGTDWTADGSVEAGSMPSSSGFWADPFWTRAPFWQSSAPPRTFWSDPFWTRTSFWEA